jgi:hypothetical protein
MVMEIEDSVVMEIEDSVRQTRAGSPPSPLTTGAATVPLPRSGPYYFVNGAPAS